MKNDVRYVINEVFHRFDKSITDAQLYANCGDNDLAEVLRTDVYTMARDSVWRGWENPDKVTVRHNMALALLYLLGDGLMLDYKGRSQSAYSIMATAAPPAEWVMKAMAVVLDPYNRDLYAGW